MKPNLVLEESFSSPRARMPRPGDSDSATPSGPTGAAGGGGDLPLKISPLLYLTLVNSNKKARNRTLFIIIFGGSQNSGGKKGDEVPKKVKY